MRLTDGRRESRTERNHWRAARDLEQYFAGRLRYDEPLAKHCSFGVGGPADLFLTATNRDELVRAITVAGQTGTPTLVLGSGANVLPSDGGYRGLVVRNVARRVDMLHDDDTVTADSGVSMPALARRAAMAGLGGLEWGTGIPGTVGGSTVNNAGAHGGCVADRLVGAWTVDVHGDLRYHLAAELDFGYRSSNLKSRGENPPRLREVVVASTFRVEPRDSSEMMRAIECWAEERRSRQPLKSDSAGSFFQNPPGDFAGRLIEQSGLKGMRLGGAEVSRLHANFLINADRATADDIFRLGQEVRQTVYARTQVWLDMEVELVGGWDSVVAAR